MAQSNKKHLFARNDKGYLYVGIFIPMYTGRIKVDTMHFPVGSTYKMLPDVGKWCNTLACMIHTQLMLHCVTSFLVSVYFVPSLNLHYFCR